MTFEVHCLSQGSHEKLNADDAVRATEPSFQLAASAYAICRTRARAERPTHAAARHTSAHAYRCGRNGKDTSRDRADAREHVIVCGWRVLVRARGSLQRSRGAAIH